MSNRHRLAVLQAMETRARKPVPEGEPIIPFDEIAIEEDIKRFQVIASEMKYKVWFGQDYSVTKTKLVDPNAKKPSLNIPPSKLSKKQKKELEDRVELVPFCRLGDLADEFLHVWNNRNENRGLYLSEEDARQQRFLWRLRAKSGTPDDRLFHQLELANYVEYLKKSNAQIPIFVWKIFRKMAKL